MADTCRGEFPNEKCSDCKGLNVMIKHWGPLVPEGAVGLFCFTCISARDKDFRDGRPPRQLGEMAT